MFLVSILCVSLMFIYGFDASLTDILCDRQTEVSGSMKISDPYYYPKKWNDTISAPIYAQNQKCRWIVYIPIEYYVLFTMEASIESDSVLNITDTNGKSEIVMTSDQQPYVFVGNSFTIDLTIGATGNSTTFGFKVQWIDYPSANATLYTVNKTSSSLIADAGLFGNAQTITAETRVSIVVFPSIFPECTPLLRLSLVFDGPDINSKYLGTLFQSLRSNEPFTSSGSQLTVYTFQEDYFSGTVYIAQDYYNVQNMSNIRGITCMSNSSCPVTLNAARGPVAAMTLNIDDGDEYIKRLDMSADSVLKVYIGTKKTDNDNNMIVSYDLNQAATNIPQKFNGAIMTYYLEEGTALVELAEDSNYTRWNDACDGREGFITSTSFGFLSNDQNTYDYISGLDNLSYSFKINVSYVDFSSNSSLTIDFQTELGTKEYVFSSENPSQSTVFTEVGTNMTVSYVTNGTDPTRGFYLDFKIGYALSASSFENTFMVLILILMVSM